jgi:hypothetical protein
LLSDGMLRTTTSGLTQESDSATLSAPRDRCRVKATTPGSAGQV